jgi:hypothetical protein
MPELTAMEEITSFMQSRSRPETSKGFMIEGEIYNVAPYNKRGSLDFTSGPGKGSSALFSFLFWLAKWRFKVVQVANVMEISPVHSQYYQMTIQQKQQLESQIKSGLASITSAVSDFELLFHDLRKYKDHVDIFEKIDKGKKESNEALIKEGEQSLKAIFIDEVDVHTGEGIALKLIAPRWPTIIADFMQLTDDDKDPKSIAKKYNISEAEGVVLATKNKLYINWKGVFKQTILDRFNRLFAMSRSRKKSIDEYKSMMKPYITRYRSIVELGSSEWGRRFLEGGAWARPTAQAVSIDRSIIWAFKTFRPPDIFKAGLETFRGNKIDVRRMPFPLEFREILIKNYDALKDAGLDEVDVSINGIEPLDKYVTMLAPHIEKHYNVKFTPIDFLQARKNLFALCGEYGWADPYFAVLDMTITRMTARLQDGSELEDITIDPFLPYVDTQNVMLLRMLEIKAQEKSLERYISEMIGEMPEGTKVQDLLKEYSDLFEYKEQEKKEEKGKKKSDVLSKLGLDFSFFRTGQYEPHFEDNVNGPYFRELNDFAISPAVGYWKGAFEVPGFRRPGFVK